MVLKIRATFDGEKLVPNGPVALTPNEQYDVTVEPAGAQTDVPDISTQLAALATDMGVTDLAERHREYARGRKFGGTLPE
jgi:hypothetical protein